MLQFYETFYGLGWGGEGGGGFTSCSFRKSRLIKRDSEEVAVPVIEKSGLINPRKFPHKDLGDSGSDFVERRYLCVAGGPRRPCDGVWLEDQGVPVMVIVFAVAVVSVTIKMDPGKTFRGFLLLARRADRGPEHNDRIGSFELVAGTQRVCDRVPTATVDDLSLFSS